MFKPFFIIIHVVFVIVTVGCSHEVFTNIVTTGNLKVATILSCKNDSLRDLRKLDLTLLRKLIHVRNLNMDVMQDVEEFLKFQPYFTNVYLNYSKCSGSRKILEKISDKKLFNATRSFVIFGSSVDTFSALDINVDAKIYAVTDSLKIKSIFGVQKQDNGLDIETIESGSYRNKTFNLVQKAFIRPNLKRLVLSTCSYIPDNPKGQIFMKYIVGLDEGHRDSVHRMGIQIMLILSEMYNFKIHWTRATAWGYLINATTWSGCMRQFAENRIELMASPILYFSQRHPLIDCGLFVYRFREAFIFRHPKSGKGVAALKNPFLMPLGNDVWVFLLIFSGLMLVVFYLVSYYEFGWIGTFPTAFLSVIGAVAQQGISDLFVSIHGKILIMTSLLMAFFIMQYYSASIVGSLLTPVPKSIKDEKTLMESDIKLTLEDLPSSLKAFQWSGSDITHELYRRKIKGQEVLIPMEEGLKLVKRGGYAFFTFVDYAYDFIKKSFTADEIDDLVEIDVFPSLVEEAMYYAVKKYSPYRELIRVGNQWIMETGILSYWTRRWSQQIPVGNLDNNEVAEVDFAHFLTMVYLLVVGILASGTIFCGEYIFHKITTLRRHKRNSLSNKE